MTDDKPRVRISSADGSYACAVAVPVRGGWAIERAVVYSYGYEHAADEVWRQVARAICRAQKDHGRR